MDVSALAWLLTVGALVALLVFDLVVAVRRPHEPSAREAAVWTGVYVSLAVLFGLGVLAVSGSAYAGEFYAGWLTEYSLSVDNLFVFVVIMSTFAVPRENQQKVLLVGVALALVLRGGFIAVGAAAIDAFSWVFYVFGALLLYTAVKLATGRGGDGHYSENAVLRFVRRVLPATDDYDGAKVLTRVAGRRMVTPMLVVMAAIGTTDVLFALDSIPAIFGLTKEPYLVFTANAFALLGLRQLYFLLGGLLDRLVYLDYGLAVVLGFIGVKLVLEAMHESGVSWAPEIPVPVSLSVIVVTLLVATVASLVRARRPAPGPDPQDTPPPAHRQA